MKKNKIIVVMIFLVILFILAIFLYKQMFSDYRGDVTAEIYQDGKLIQTIDLVNVTEAYDLVITNKNGGENTVHVDVDGISVSHADCPDQVFAARKDSPLIVGQNEDGCFIASDVPAILRYTRKVYYVDNQEVVRLRADHMHF